ELCRQRMATRPSERPEAPRASRVSSVSSQLSDGPTPSPPARGSTSSWSEEPAPPSMDISTGHMVLTKSISSTSEKVPSDAEVQITSADGINDVSRNIKRRNEEQIETETTEQDGEIAEQHKPRQRKRISVTVISRPLDEVIVTAQAAVVYRNQGDVQQPLADEIRDRLTPAKAYMEDHLQNKDRLQKEWEALCAYQAEPNSSLVAQREENVPKNRCPAVLTYDHSRVLLRPEGSHSSSDYINASPITDHDPRSPAYIATQGPLPTTVADFWQASLFQFFVLQKIRSQIHRE
ncbi:Receptor-type tyrosine-protein phosphatase N2, partial [Pteropus alecto]